MEHKETQKQQMTGYPSVDKPWLKYYSEEAINAPLPEGSLYDYMISCNKGHMDDTALNYFGRKFTYRQFDAAIEECARALAAYGVEKGDIVSLCMLTMPEVLILLYAVNCVGAVCNFLVLNATEQEMHKQIQLAESRLVFTVSVAAEKVLQAARGTNVKEVVSIPLSASMPVLTASMARLTHQETADPKGATPWKAFLKGGGNAAFVPVTVGKDDLAVLEYTSGTTGESKGVMLSNQAVNSVAFYYRCSSTVFEFRRGERFLCVIPPFITVGLVTTLVMPVCVGFELILYPNPEPSATVDNVIRYRPNHLCAAPIFIDNLIEDKRIEKMDLSFISTVAYGGDKSDSSWEKRVTDFLFARGMSHELVNGYGLTETAASFCSTTHRTNFMIPFVKNNIMICDTENGEELRYGEEGEVCVAGPSLMLGYYKNPEATADLIFERDGARWMRTGDLGMVTEDGAFRITGRLKRIFWSLGEDGIVYRVYPMKIEEVIARCPEVKQCGVVGLANGKRGYFPVAYVVLRDKDMDHEDIRCRIQEICRKELNSTSQIHELYFMDRLPLTRAGKIDFQELERMAAGRERIE